MTEPLDDAQGELRKVCHAGGDLGCSCAGRNYQWFDHACREQIVTAFKNMLNAQAARAAPARCDADIEEADEALKAFGRATTQTNIDYPQRLEAILTVEKFLQKHRRALAVTSTTRGTP